MVILSRILLIVFALMTINSGVKYPLEKLTMYRKSDISSQATWFIILFVFFGIFMLPFYKPIKQYRKLYYIKNVVRSYEYWCLSLGLRPPDLNAPLKNIWPESIEPQDIYHEEYRNNKRYLKLIKLQRKTKRMYIFTKLKGKICQ